MKLWGYDLFSTNVAWLRNEGLPDEKYMYGSTLFRKRYLGLPDEKYMYGSLLFRKKDTCLMGLPVEKYMCGSTVFRKKGIR